MTAEYVLHDMRTAQRVVSAVMELVPSLTETPHSVEIKPYKPRRSLNANAYFHVLVDKIARVLKLGADECKTKFVLEYGTPESYGEAGIKGAFEAREDVPIKALIPYAKAIGERVIAGKRFVQYVVYKPTHALNKSEMARLVDGVAGEAKQLGIETRTPAEIAALISAWDGRRP